MTSLARAAITTRTSSAAIRPAPHPPLPGAPSDEVADIELTEQVLRPLKPTKVFNTYWRFAHERQEIYFRRVKGEPAPWTSDPVLSEHKFTNAYRATDRVSQYLIRRVIYEGEQTPSELFFRIMLFKLFNKIETWELLRHSLGEVRWADYSYRKIDGVLTRARSKGQRIYSAAYIMPSGVSAFGSRTKHRNHLRLLERMMADDLAHRVADAPTMMRAFELLRAYPMMGDFLAYQYVTDLNYSTLTDFAEGTFVVPGPGARDGIRKCFADTAGLTDGEVIRVVCENQSEQFKRLGLDFKSLWGRPLQLIDCQNLFCEVDKYARVVHPDAQGLTGRTRIKQKFRPKATLDKPWFPPKWDLNVRVCGDLA